MELNNSSLHHVILRSVIDQGYAPEVDELSKIFNTSEKHIEQALYDLQEYHGVLLHPHTPKVWVIHPFALAPTNFILKSSKGSWWGNCAWCSLGAAALLDHDLTITSSFGAYGEPVVIHIQNGEVVERDLLVHFPIAMRHAWDNVQYTCSNMLIFKDAKHVDLWSDRHRIPKGDVQPLHLAWELAKKWYGNHMNPEWEKWTVAEAKDIFESFDLDHPVWDLESSTGRF